MEAGLSDRAKLILVWPVAAFFVVIAFGVGLISMAVFNNNNQVQAVGATTASSDTHIVEVTLGDLFIKPAQLKAEAGAVTFEVANEGKTEHNFAIDGHGATEMIPPGESATFASAFAQGR